jgi:hypothetical protein
MKKLMYLLTGLLALAACHKKEMVEIPVTKIEIVPASTGLFIGDETTVLVKCYPENATNVSLLTVSNSNSNVASFEQGKLKAKAAGTSALQARCGDAYAQARVTVYSGYFTKGGKKYGVDSATGYYITMGESTPQEIQLTLTYYDESGDTQNFWLDVKCSNFGKTIDFLKDMDGSMVSVQMNNNEDGYCVPYAREDGTPAVVLADWGYTDAILVKGLLTVESPATGRFKVSADFALSNDYTFTASWEGTAAMKTE